MSQFNSPPDILDVLKDMRAKIQALVNTQHPPTYTTATRPLATQVTGGTIIFVSDATSGQRFQGWDSTAGAWVPLG